MPQTNWDSEFKKKIVRLHILGGCSLKSLAAEYHVPKASISLWCKQFREEWLEKVSPASNNQTELEIMQENYRLRKELEELKKENLFLKKAVSLLCILSSV